MRFLHNTWLCLGVVGCTFGLSSVSAQTPTGQAAPPSAVAPAAQEESAEALLARCDKQNAAFSDAFFHFKMVVKSSSGAVEREVEFTTKQKGNQQRLVRFLSPGDIKGMGFLLEGPGVMYAKLPAFGNRVRRLGTSQMNQSFMGSDLSSEDMSAIDYAPSYAATSAGSDGALRVLSLQLKPGKASEFPRLKMWIEPTKAIITKIEYYDAAGKKLRTSDRSDFKEDGPGHHSPGKMTYIDHRRGDHKTDMILVKSTLNNGYSADEFSLRALQRD
ncbi:MAG TPA: outer membrane lipoprotein-sorting protein [Pseudomonadota bacterium]|nr:outer membrane lipoprotein-sorting protein [Pseudomonadota bacterium]